MILYSFIHHIYYNMFRPVITKIPNSVTTRCKSLVSQRETYRSRRNPRLFISEARISGNKRSAKRLLAPTAVRHAVALRQNLRIRSTPTLNPRPLVQWVLRALSPDEKRAVRETDISI